MRYVSQGVALPSALALLVSGCIRDQLDSVHQCQVVSPNDRWSSNGITMDVTAPVCPVVISYAGSQIYFSSRTRAPTDMPNSNLGTTIIDLTGDVVTDLLAIFQPISSTSTEALTTGFYSAGRDGIPIAPDRPIQDRGYTFFYVTPAYGSGIADAFALMPYKITNPPVSAAKVTPSNWNSPKIGVPTILRAVPQVNEQVTPVRFLWSFDGKAVLDSAASRDPRYPVYFNGRIFSATVWTRGVHTWKVDMTYGTWPNEKVATITWRQTFY